MAKEVWSRKHARAHNMTTIRLYVNKDREEWKGYHKLTSVITNKTSGSDSVWIHVYYKDNCLLTERHPIHTDTIIVRGYLTANMVRGRTYLSIWSDEITIQKEYMKKREEETGEGYDELAMMLKRMEEQGKITF